MMGLGMGFVRDWAWGMDRAYPFWGKNVWKKAHRYPLPEPKDILCPWITGGFYTYI
jgi:hypothetical protein